MNRKNDKYVLAGAVALITFLVYLTSLHNEFVEWDDSVYVFENPFIKSFDLAFFKWAFFDFYASNWHPLTWISHALDYAVWGLDPMGHHLTNNILHAVNTFLVVLLALKLLASWQAGKQRSSQITSDPADLYGAGNSQSSINYSRFALIAAGVTGLLFGLNPIHVESVAWASERKDLLCAFFFLLSILMYTKYAGATLLIPPLERVDNKEGRAKKPKKDRKQPPQPFASTGKLSTNSGPSFITETNTKSLFSKYYLFALGFFILSLLSKPMAVSLPLVLLILDWYPFGKICSIKTFRTSFAGKLPFFALSIASSIITVLAQRTEGAMKSMEAIPLSSRVLVATRSLIAYLWKMLVPINLTPYYPYPRDVELLSSEYLLPIIFVISITAISLFLAKKKKLLLSAWGYYVLTLMPVIGIVQVGNQSMADRYTYLPSLGPFLLLGLLLAWVWERPQKLTSLMRYAALSSAALFLLYISFLTVKQIEVWKNTFSLWTYVIEKEPMKVPVAYNNRGLNFGKAGLLDKAIEDFDMAIEVDPKYSDAYNNRGYAYSLIGRNAKASDDLSKAIELDNNFLEAYLNRANLYLKTGKKELAVSDFQRACVLGRKAACGAAQSLRLSMLNQEDR